jgi:hypothetical protein
VLSTTAHVRGWLPSQSPTYRSTIADMNARLIDAASLMTFSPPSPLRE